MQTEEIDAAEVARLWPFADLSPFEAFAWEARGGYGDAYQTAQAFAVSARAAGVRIRQGADVTGLLIEGDKVTGVRLADGTEIAADTVVVATGVWTRPFLAPYGIDVPIRVVREQLVMIAPGVESAACPVFSDLVSLQYIRPELGGEVLFGNSDLSDVEDADPDDYLNRATEDFVDLTVERVGTRFPGFTDAAITGSYAGCYDVTPDWNPVIIRTERRRARRRRRIQRPRLQDRTRGRPADRRPRRRRPQCRPAHSGNRLPAVPVRRGRPAQEPVSVCRCRADALDPRNHDRHPAAAQPVRHGP